MLEIVTYPNEILKKKTSLVKSVDSEIKDIIAQMKDTMYKNDGVGLAANQVNISLSIMTIDTTPNDRYKDEDREIFKAVLINPEILETSGQTSIKEGCLSFPELRIEVPRFSYVKIKAINEHEEEVIFELTGFPAIVFQHEFDHLSGITFIDRLSGLKRRMALEKYKKLLKEKVSA